MTKEIMLQKLQRFYDNFCTTHNCRSTEVTPMWFESDKHGLPHVRSASDSYIIELRPVFRSFELDIENQETKVIYVVTFSNSVRIKATGDYDYSKDNWRISQFRVDGVETDIQKEIEILQSWIKSIEV